jgi:hypothetical protein
MEEHDGLLGAAFEDPEILVIEVGFSLAEPTGFALVFWVFDRRFD